MSQTDCRAVKRLEMEKNSRPNLLINVKKKIKRNKARRCLEKCQTIPLKYLIIKDFHSTDNSHCILTRNK